MDGHALKTHVSFDAVAHCRGRLPRLMATSDVFTVSDFVRRIGTPIPFANLPIWQPVITEILK